MSRYDKNPFKDAIEAMRDTNGVPLHVEVLDSYVQGKETYQNIGRVDELSVQSVTDIVGKGFALELHCGKSQSATLVMSRTDPEPRRKRLHMVDIPDVEEIDMDFVKSVVCTILDWDPTQTNKLQLTIKDLSYRYMIRAKSFDTIKISSIPDGLTGDVSNTKGEVIIYVMKRNVLL